jgi:hypothetical protein
LKQRVFEALAPGTVPGHPAPMGLAASACCSGMLTIVIATTPNNASAATMAITTNVVLLISELKKTLFLKSSATRLCYETFLQINANNSSSIGFG